MKHFFPFILVLAFISPSCKSSKPLVIPIEPEFETEILDTLTVNGNDPRFWEEDEQERPYQANAPRYFDLLHTRLDLKFDFARQWVFGVANLDLVPYFHPQDSLVLDAKGMQIDKVWLRTKNTPFTFRNDGTKLTIYLGSKYQKSDSLKISIQYIAKPNEGIEGGSDAINSDKGLFFINPIKSDSLKPVQIWTQGETENNSRWFPTIDKPNERCTQEITLTVDDRFTTLSNGSLISSTKNADGSRTDYWRQDKAHAPYLAMIAVGEYAVVKDQWENIPLQYMVEKPYEAYAKQIFNHTPEMMGFFSRLFGYKYPWEKFAQIVTRDYVSGAMENTTAVVYGEFVQKTVRELIDNDNDYIVAHELSHHWFGNLVTLESWANLVLNEGFANYAEYLWLEYKYGRMRADEHRYNELNGYLNSTFNGMHPLIHFRYADKEDMFDAHSYNKGGLVLHYLRNYLGDEAFFTALNRYLNLHAYTDVEAEELRMAFEDVCGEDLNWFFDQWFKKKGHPEFAVTYQYDETSRSLTVTSQQEATNIWKIPVDIALYDATGKPTYYRHFTTAETDVFTIQNVNDKPLSVVFDGKNYLPGIVEEDKSNAQWLATFIYSGLFADKYKACQMIEEDSPERASLINLAFGDPYYFFRDFAINVLMQNGTVGAYQDKLIQMAKSDPHSLVRESAIRALGMLSFEDKSALYEAVLSKEQAYNVLGEALTQLNLEKPEKAAYICSELENENAPYLINKIAAIYAVNGNSVNNEWFVKKIQESNPYQMFELCGYYNMYLLERPNEFKKKAVQMYKEIGQNVYHNKYKRYIGTASLFSLKNLLIAQKLEEGKQTDAMIEEISKAITSIKATEKDNELIERYSEF
ncbi:MAG: alanyl aminopeptidase [Saprospiraceae bacterium]|nr:alanyl aminopeptidase [Saprospiraceae bacterium]